MTAWLNVKNNAESALSAALTAAATTLTLVSGDGARFPASNFNISIDDEILTCSSRTGDVLTVARAQEGTTAAAHAAGAIVSLNLTAAVITQLQDAIDAVPAGRERLTASRTYYVRTDGNDSNSGLINSTAGAFLTIQKAIDAAAALDCSIYDVIIQLGAGTYVITSTIILKSILGSGSVTIIGNESSPTDVVLDGQNVMDIILASGVPYTVYKLKGFKLFSSTSNATMGFRSSRGSNIEYQNLYFGSGLIQQVRVDDGGSVKCTGNYTVAGGAQSHLALVNGSLRIQGVTITISGTPSFTTAYADIEYGSVAIVNNCTYVNKTNAAGARYLVAMNAVCFTGGQGDGYFPGNAAGAVQTGGQYG